METETFLTRHSTKGKGSKYEQLSVEGVEKAKERAKELVELFEKAEKGSVIFMGGNSKERRTRSTLQVYTDELKSEFGDREDYLFFDREQIKKKAENGYSNTARELQEEADKHPEAKVIVDLQFQLKGIGDMSVFMNEQGEVKEEWAQLLKKHGKNYTSAIKEWFENKNTDIDPTKMAERYLHSMERLESFVKKFSGDRKTKFVIVGHSFEIDALLTYLTNEGKIDATGFEKVGGEVIDEAELAVIEQGDGDNKLRLHYRNQEFTCDQFLVDHNRKDKY